MFQGPVAAVAIALVTQKALDAALACKDSHSCRYLCMVVGAGNNTASAEGQGTN